jgi:O-antigen/teichoic acid export membrane protein
MLSVLTDLGLGTATVREIARDRSVARRCVSNAVTIKVITSLLVMGLIAAGVRLLGYSGPTAMIVRICGLYAVASAFAQYFGFVFQGFERMEFTALGRVLQTLILIIGAVVLSRGPASAVRYALLYAGAGLVSAGFSYSVCSVYFVKPGVSLDLAEWRRAISPALPIGVASMFVVFYYWNGSTLLSKLNGDAAVGNYNAAFRLVTGLTFVGFAFTGALLPYLSRLFHTTPGSLQKALEVSIRYTMIIALPLAIFGATLSATIVAVLYGDAYRDAAEILRVLALWGGCACLNSLLSTFFISIDRVRTFVMQTGIALGTNVILNVALMPSLGALGAAISILIAETTSLVFYLVQLRPFTGSMRIRPILTTLLGGGGAAVVGSYVALVVARRSPLVGLLTGPLLFLLLLLSTGVIGKEDWGFVRSMPRDSDGDPEHVGWGP